MDVKRGMLWVVRGDEEVNIERYLENEYVGTNDAGIEDNEEVEWVEPIEVGGVENGDNCSKEMLLVGGIASGGVFLKYWVMSESVGTRAWIIGNKPEVVSDCKNVWCMIHNE